MRNAHIGSTFESFLEEQGFKEEVDLLAQKRIIAWQIEQAMAERKSRLAPRAHRPSRCVAVFTNSTTKADMAARMKTSRTQIDRLLDPQNNRIQLDTLQRAALAVGRSLKLELARTPHADRARRTVQSSGRMSKRAAHNGSRPALAVVRGQAGTVKPGSGLQGTAGNRRRDFRGALAEIRARSP